MKKRKNWGSVFQIQMSFESLMKLNFYLWKNGKWRKKTKRKGEIFVCIFCCFFVFLFLVNEGKFF